MIRNREIHNLFRPLDLPPQKTKEPKAEVVGVGKIAKMVAKKTKFRVVDVEEVLNESVDAIYSLILQRKTIDLNGLYLYCKWYRLKTPVYFHNPEKWNFGYFIPEIKMNRFKKSLFMHIKGEKVDSLIEKIRPYLPEDVKKKDLDEIYDCIEDIFYSTGSLGKDLVVSDKNLIYLMNGKESKQEFDENYHPTWAEKMYRMSQMRKIMKEAAAIADANPDEKIKDVFNRLMDERGIYRRGGSKIAD